MLVEYVFYVHRTDSHQNITENGFIQKYCHKFMPETHLSAGKPMYTCVLAVNYR